MLTRNTPPAPRQASRFPQQGKNELHPSHVEIPPCTPSSSTGVRSLIVSRGRTSFLGFEGLIIVFFICSQLLLCSLLIAAHAPNRLRAAPRSIQISRPPRSMTTAAWPSSV